MNLQNQLDYLPSLLDGVVLPSEDLDLDLLKSVLMERCGLLTPLYSEPETMKQVISIWFRSHQWNIERLIALVKTSYSPLENYDRHEDLARDMNTTENRTENHTENRTQNFTENGTVGSTETAERTVAAFNTSTYSPADKTVTGGTTTTHSGGQTAGQNAGATAGQTAGQEAEHAVNWIHGNIGVTTSQAMFQAELDLLGGFNSYQYIIEKFANDCLLSIW